MPEEVPWTHKEVDLALHPVVRLVLKEEMQRRFLRRVVSQTWILFFRVSKQGPCFTAIEEDGGDKRFVQLELAREADGAAPPDPV